MKRILFYTVIIIQIGVVALLGFQYTMIDKFGVPIKLELEDDSYEYYEDYQGNIHLSYKINMIPSSKWEVDKTAVYNERVYVLLEADENEVYHVVKATSEKIYADDNQIVVLAKNDSNSYFSGMQSVTYGFELIKGSDLIEGTNASKNRVATILIAPWGQNKVVEIKKQN